MKTTQAEDEKSSAFVVSQEDIDSVLQMGSSYDKSKYRIYRQLQKNSDSKTNIEFLKKEYGTGGGTHIFPDGTQGGRWADSKGIAIEKQGSYTDPDLRLSWSKVEKRLRELIKNDRYLNPKEKDHYADYLEQVSAPQYEIDTQRKLVRQRFIQSKQALSPADKRDSLALRLSDFIRDLDGYEKELLSQVNRTDLANINDRQMEEQLSDPATVQQLLDFLALVQGKTSDTYSRSNAWYFSKELTELHPTHHIKGGKIFGALESYKSKSFYEKHKTIHFDTLTEQAEYEIVAVFKTVAYSAEGYRYYDFVNAETEEAFAEYVAKCKELALYDTGVSAEYGDKLITLSTCEYSAQNGRLVVVAKKVV